MNRDPAKKIYMPSLTGTEFYDTREKHNIPCFIEESLDDTAIFIKDIQTLIIRYLLPVFDLRNVTLAKYYNKEHTTIIGDTDCKNIDIIKKQRLLYSNTIMFFSDTSSYIWIDEHDVYRGLKYYFKDRCLISDSRLLFSIDDNKVDFFCRHFCFKVKKLIHRKNYCTVITECAIFKIDDTALFKPSKYIHIKDDFIYNQPKLFKEEYHQLTHKRIARKIPSDMFLFRYYNTAQLLINYYIYDDSAHNIRLIRDACIYL